MPIHLAECPVAQYVCLYERPVRPLPFILFFSDPVAEQNTSVTINNSHSSLHLAQVSSFLAIEVTALREVELMNETR